MKRAGFYVATGRSHGRGHEVRCKALADELYARGWEIINTPTMSQVSDCDVLIVDHPGMITGGHKVVRILDLPEQTDARLAVCGSAGATSEMFFRSGFNVLAGPEYALLRPEFARKRAHMDVTIAHIAMRSPGVLDLRDISDLTADQIASSIYCAVAEGATIETFAGMRALEVACVGYGADVVLYPRNAGEQLNADGLMAGAGARVDGLGCKRVADEIEEKF